MYEHQNDSVSSIASDGLGWLRAYNTFVFDEDTSPSQAQPIDIPSRTTVPLPVAPHDSLKLLRTKRKHYEAPTKSSSAKLRKPLPYAEPPRPGDIDEGSRSSSPHAQQWIYRRPRPSPSSSTTSITRLSSLPPSPRRESPSPDPESPSKPKHFWKAIIKPDSSSKESKNSPYMAMSSSSKLGKRRPSALTPMKFTRSGSMSSSTESTMSIITPTSPMFNRSRQGSTSSYATASSVCASSSPSKSILSSTPRRSCSTLKRKNSLATITSSKKSVKFEEKPTVRYASRGYWDFPDCLEEEDEMMIMSSDDDDDNDDDDLDDQRTLSGSPSPPRTPSPSTRHRWPAIVRDGLFLDGKRCPSSRNRKLAISGPFALGHPPPANASVSLNAVSAKGTLHPAPSTESFRSAKSSKSSKSVRSVRSSVSENARGFKDWMKTRLGLGVVLSQ